MRLPRIGATTGCMRRVLVLMTVAGCLGGCGDDSASATNGDATGEPAATSSSSGGSGASSSGSSGAAEATDPTETSGAPMDDAVIDDFYGRLLGLWTAPVDSWTSVGNLPLMTMDVRPADGRTLFSRVDLDGGNALRFAFSRETHGGEDVLVYRNGGLFLGIERDSRTQLVEHDAEEDRFRFCSIDRGCDYIDAVFDFDGSERFALDVDVGTMMHIHWAPTRSEARPLETPFPADSDANPGDVPFPEMPTLNATLTWSEPLAEAARVWLILSTVPCAVPPGSCTPARFISGEAEAGATEADLTIVQIHPATTTSTQSSTATTTSPGA